MLISCQVIHKMKMYEEQRENFLLSWKLPNHHRTAFVPNNWVRALVMGRTPFYRTSIELEHHFLNIERTQTCSSIGDRTRTPYFWLRTNEHRTSNLIGLSLNLLNYSSNWLEHHFSEHRTNSNMFIYWGSNSNTLILASNEQTSNIKPK